MSNKPFFKHFDLPTQHLPEGEHYVVPPARDADEIARRRANPAGTTMAEFQRDGLLVGAAILEQVQEPEDVTFVTKLLGAAATNTAWYCIGRNAAQMRKVIQLPRLLADDSDRHPNPAAVMEMAIDGFKTASQAASRIVELTRHERRGLINNNTVLGRNLGRSAVTLSCVDLASQLATMPYHLSDQEVQFNVRSSGLHMLGNARVMAEEIGSHPSIAQLPDNDSDVSVYWRRHAPAGAFEARERAVEEAVAATGQMSFL